MASARARYLLLGILCLALLGASCSVASGLLPPTPTAATPLVYHSPTPTPPRLTPTRTPLLTPSLLQTPSPAATSLAPRQTPALAPTVAPVRPLLPTPILVPLSPLPTRSPTATPGPT